MLKESSLVHVLARTVGSCFTADPMCHSGLFVCPSSEVCIFIEYVSQ